MIAGSKCRHSESSKKDDGIISVGLMVRRLALTPVVDLAQLSKVALT
jgi:hypothetical protein